MSRKVIVRSLYLNEMSCNKFKTPGAEVVGGFWLHVVVLFGTVSSHGFRTD